MEPITFLKEKLGSLAARFPHIHIRYAYKPSIATHIVELSSVEDYYKNEALEAAWIPLSIEFMETFDSENIAFISSDSSLAIVKPELEWNKPVSEQDVFKMNEVLD